MAQACVIDQREYRFYCVFNEGALLLKCGSSTDFQLCMAYVWTKFYDSCFTEGGSTKPTDLFWSIVTCLQYKLRFMLITHVVKMPSRTCAALAKVTHLHSSTYFRALWHQHLFFPILKLLVQNMKFTKFKSMFTLKMHFNLVLLFNTCEHSYIVCLLFLNFVITEQE